MSTPTGGRVVAWAGFAFGSVVSVAANVLHAWIPKPPEGAPENWVAPPDWAPSVAAQLGAAVWPIALLLSVEAISRVRWRDGALWMLVRFGGLGVVGLGSFAISYGHLHGVLDSWDYTDLGAAVGPIVIDGLMVVSGFALLSEAGEHPVAQPASVRGTKPTVAQAAAEQPKPAPVDEPTAKVHPIGDPKPWSARAKQLMEDEGVSKATAYRRAKKELTGVGA